MDEWSGDFGCGVQYFSQQAVGRLIPKAGLEIDPALGLPEKLSAFRNSWRKDANEPGQSIGRLEPT